MKTQLKETAVAEKIEKVFAEAIVNADSAVLENLLDERDDYPIIVDNNETLSANKQGFISWVLQKRSETKTLQYHLDLCIQCVFGAPVVLFNQGYFPVKNMTTKDSLGTYERIGFMLEIKGDRIHDISMCRKFLKTDNKASYEARGEEIEKYMEENDCCFHEAWNNLGIEKLLGHAPSPQMGDYDPNNRYLVVAELPKKGFILRTIDTTENWLTALIKMSFLSEDPEQERNLLIERFKSSAWYRINNSVHIPNSREEISTGLVNYRIIELSPEYTQWDFMKQRKAIKKS